MCWLEQSRACPAADTAAGLRKGGGARGCPSCPADGGSLDFRPVGCQLFVTFITKRRKCSRLRLQPSIQEDGWGSSEVTTPQVSRFPLGGLCPVVPKREAVLLR